MLLGLLGLGLAAFELRASFGDRRIFGDELGLQLVDAMHGIEDHLTAIGLLGESTGEGPNRPPSSGCLYTSM